MSDMVTRIICLFIGYAFGLFQTSYLYGRAHGIDIRKYGSGNAGTTNALRTLGRKAGLITFIGDVLKCVFSVVLVHLLFGKSQPENIRLFGLYAAAGCIIGHNFPFYLNFKGGKGIAATAGMIFSFNWIVTVVCAILFFGTFFSTHYVSLGSLLVYIGFVVSVVILGQTGYWDMSQSSLTEMYILAILLAMLAFWKHRSNIKRLLNGTERKTFLSKQKETTDGKH